MFVGVDIGGTFTDLVLSADGELKIHKLLSTPGDPAQAMLAGLRAVSPQGLEVLARIAHGTTVATNAILERKGAKSALITTQGFRDLLFIGRQNRPLVYALAPELPPPLIPREHCYEVPERLDHTGAVLQPLDLVALDHVLDQIEAAGIESVAIGLLYSYVNGDHERAVRARILERGLLTEEQIALSCEVLPEFREYERASTVALEAYVRPVMSRYLGHLESTLPLPGSLRVMKSDGGIISANNARRRTILTALSGPAAGVIGAFHVAKLAGFDQIISLDMGGTSTDVALCPGTPIRRSESEIDGLPLRMRLLDIETVGAGGGSIARLDSGGALRVGPESAGADPGPICYGRGGTQVTVSDANAVLGRLDAEHFLGGQMMLDLDAAQSAVQALADQMHLALEEAALGVLALANANIDRAVRRVSIARGYDPRDFTLVAFGGAGPLHACDVAARLNIPRVLIPRSPGVLCALGLLVADVTLDTSASLLGSSISVDDLVNNLLARARDELTREGIAEADMSFTPLLDARYRGQAYELTIPLSDDIEGAFHAAHERAYGHALPGREVELVNLRLQATGSLDKPTLMPEPIIENDGSSAHIGHRHGLTLYQREQFTPGARFSGAALIFQLDSTVYVPEGWSAQVDGYRNLVLSR
ncbi:MAG TPA: hydantoinase/oxoprolinase family protein [Phototrophicaceae bacterium]|nr:hydantoinase/oxoprolinase family protein [Phototrophicaceae bacterium]